MLLAIITFIIILGVLVVAHELGHFVAARKAGVKVLEFGLGFPPRIKGVQRGETIYSVNWIPLGGFVRIKGEDGEHRDESDSFACKSFSRKVGILAAGVAMNFILAFVLLSIGFAVGLPTVLDETTTGAIRNREIKINAVVENSPAGQAGLETGDSLQTLDGQKFVNLEAMQNYISQNSGREIDFQIQRGQDILAKKITPQIMEKIEISRPIIGVELVETGLVSYPIHQAIWLGAKTTASLTMRILEVVGAILKGLFTSEAVPQDVAGPIGIAVVTNRVVDLGGIYVLQFAALLSINLAILNILPFPALDGGRILFAIIEKIRQKPNSQKIENAVHNTGFILLMIAMAAITYRDLARWGGQILSALGRIF